MAYVVIVTGWRAATADRDTDVIAQALRSLDPHGPVTLRHGQCPYGGVDLIAHNLATEWGWKVEPYPPEIRNGRIQGPARNRAMCAAEPSADMVLAFPGPGSRGTWDCLHWAQRYNIPFRGVPLQVRGHTNA